MRLTCLTGAAMTVLLFSPLAFAQAPGPATSAGPGRVVCKTAKLCELGIGEPAKLKYQINVEALPEADKERLTKQCKSDGKTPCVATVDGTEMGDPVKIKAVKIKWYN